MTENTPKHDDEALEAMKRQQEEKVSFAEAGEDMSEKFKSPTRAMRRKLARQKKKNR